MYPPVPGPATQSEAERILFTVIERELSDDWIVLHSLGLVIHLSKPWAEIDFVLIGPPGVMCLEVKGGRVARRDGLWVFTDRHGKETTKSEGPFEQVGKASSALWDYLRHQFEPVSGSMLGYGVLTPDIRFQPVEPDVLREVVYDAADVGNPFGEYISRLTGYWGDRIAEQRRRRPGQLDSRAREALLNLLRPDFDARLSLRARADIINREMVRLTSEQFRVVDGLIDNERAMVIGGAGTGKTLLAVEEARRQAHEGRSVLLTCFSRRLSEVLAGHLRDETGVAVVNFHRFMVRTVEAAGLASRLRNASTEDLMSVDYPELCYEALVEASTPPFDTLIIDEAQDLLRDLYLDVFDAALAGGLNRGRWRMFYDPRQDAFQGIQPSGMIRVRNIGPAQFRLTVNCRNTAPIATAIGLLAGYEPDETLTIEGPEVIVKWSSSPAAIPRMVDAAVRELLSGGLSSDEIVILSPSRLSGSSMAHQSRVGGLPLLDDEEAARTRGVRFHTVRGFKGLESAAILLVDVPDLRERESLLTAYLGGSRARTFLYVYLPESARDDYLERANLFGKALASSTPRAMAQ